MIIIRLSHAGWEKRNQIFKWCEEAFGKCKYKSSVWKFYSDYEGTPDIMPRQSTVVFYDDNFASMFLLKWGNTVFFRGMRPIKEFHNRMGIESSGVAGIYIRARLQLKQEHFMLPRAMRKYWDEINAPLYGPCGCVSSWLKWKKVDKGRRLRRMK